MAAQYGVATFVSIQRQVPITYPVQFHLDDTAGNLILWDVGGGDAAKGANEWKPPEAVKLIDFVIAAASGQTKTTLNRAGAKIGTLLNSVQLASVVQRPGIAMLFGPAAPISGNQVA